jgi:adenylylsulfate kinase-like enzyme
MVIWLIGLSRSGKTTIGKKIIKALKKKRDRKIIHLDGDVVREIYNDKLGHTVRDREINASRISRLSKFLSDQGIDVVASVLSNFPKWQAWNKKNIKKYHQIYLKVDFEKLLERDTNKLYKKALGGKIKNVIGVDIKFNKPIPSTIIVDNNEKLKNFDKITEKILSKINI